MRELCSFFRNFWKFSLFGTEINGKTARILKNNLWLSALLWMNSISFHLFVDSNFSAFLSTSLLTLTRLRKNDEMLW